VSAWAALRIAVSATHANTVNEEMKVVYFVNDLVNGRTKMPKGIRNKPLNLDILDKRFRVLSDNDGHDYIIPVGHEGNFYSWVETTEDSEESEFDFENNRINNTGWTFTNPKGY
jgi:hypothetical protein